MFPIFVNYEKQINLNFIGYQEYREVEEISIGQNDFLVVVMLI